MNDAAILLAIEKQTIVLEAIRDALRALKPQPSGQSHAVLYEYNPATHSPAYAPNAEKPADSVPVVTTAMSQHPSATSAILPSTSS
jgi:hypothetical protein